MARKKTGTAYYGGAAGSATIPYAGGVYAGDWRQVAKSVPKFPQVPSFTLTVTNTNTASAQTAVLFNANSIYNASSDAGIVIANSASVPTYANLVLNAARNPLLVHGFNYDADSKAQLSNSFEHLHGNIDGSSGNGQLGNAIALAVKNNQFIDDLLYINYPFWVDGFMALRITVAANEAIRLTFRVAQQLRVS